MTRVLVVEDSPEIARLVQRSLLLEGFEVDVASDGRGALAVVRYAVRNGTRRPWLVQLLARRTPKVAAVALANKTARMVWAIMTSGERYREPVAA